MVFKKVLVTGGCGFIESNVADELLSHRTEVIVYDNLSTGRAEFLSGAGPGLTLLKGDVPDGAVLQRAMTGCDGVFHFQANADVRGGKQDTRTDLEQNTLATWNVLV